MGKIWWIWQTQLFTSQEQNTRLEASVLSFLSHPTYTTLTCADHPSDISPCRLYPIQALDS